MSDSSEYEKAKSENKDIVAKVNHNEYKNVLLNKKFLRQSMNRIQSKTHRVRTYEVKKISFSCVDHKFIFLIMELML